MAAFVILVQSVLVYTLLFKCSIAQVGPPIPSEGCPGPTTGLICYASTECRGDIILPLAIDDGGLSSAAECCGGFGLSYCNIGGCEDCFSESPHLVTIHYVYNLWFT